MNLLRPSIVGLAAALLATCTPPARGHDPRQHQGRPLNGTVESIGADHLTLSTARGMIGIVLSDETTVERGDAPIPRDAIRSGDRVTVFGPVLPSGEIAARDVIIRSREQGPSPER
jgi:hypothetical protein